MSTSTNRAGPEPQALGGIPVQSIVAGSLQEPTVQQLFSLKGRTAVGTFRRFQFWYHKAALEELKHGIPTQ